MACDGLSLLETKLIYNCPVVRVPFFHVRMPGRQMSGDETKTPVMILQADRNGSFIPRHPSHSCLWQKRVNSECQGSQCDTYLPGCSFHIPYNGGQL